MELQCTFIPLLLFGATLFKILQGQRVDTDGVVIGYQNHDVTLSCNYIHENKKDNIVQVQWTWHNHSNKLNPMKIIINNSQHGPFVHDTFLKDRVSFLKSPDLTSDASIIIIKDVKMTDQGVYTCDYTTHPSGTQTGVTALEVKEGKPAALSTAVTAGIVTVGIIIILLASAGYFILLKRRRAASTSAYWFVIVEKDVTQSPDDLSQGEVTYADVTILKPSKVNRNTLLTGDIEYAAVSFSGRSEMTSHQGSANQVAYGAHVEERGSVYAMVERDY